MGASFVYKILELPTRSEKLDSSSSKHVVQIVKVSPLPLELRLVLILELEVSRLLVYGMAPGGQPSMSTASPTEYTFDGSNWTELVRLVTLSKLHRASQTEVDSDTTQSTWVARHFRGPALDFVTNLLILSAADLDNFDGFIQQVKDHFGITDRLVLTHYRTQLDGLQWRRDAPTFFAEFARLAQAVGMGGPKNDNSARVTLLLAKVPAKYLAILARQHPQPNTYLEYRDRLLAIWANDPTAPGVASEKQHARPKCGKCGKKGHVANDCKTPGA